MKGAHFGSWDSPLSASKVAAASLRLSEVRLTRSEVAWVEGRPAEGGRSVPVAEGVGDLIPPGFNARSRTHEYGGGSFALSPAGAVYFVNFADQRIYAIDRHPGEPIAGAGPRPITADKAFTHGDLTLTPDGEFVLAIREEGEVESIVALDVDGGGESTLAAGRDFFAAPRSSPDGRQIAWLCWDHPNMPWDGAELWLADIEVSDGGMSVLNSRKIAGGVDEAILQPRWSPDGNLHYISDRSGWWNIYRSDTQGAIVETDADFAGPPWVFGLSNYAFVGDDLFATPIGERANLIRIRDGAIAEILLPFSSFSYLESDGTRLAFVGGSRSGPPVVAVTEAAVTDVAVTEAAVTDAALTDAGPAMSTTLTKPDDPGIADDEISVATPVTYDSSLGESHAWFYEPRSSRLEGLPGELPPLITMSHGGPTSQANTNFRAEIQFWTTRGFAVVDVDYGGSSGYGREYRQRLNGRWGIIDVDDCCAAAEHLVALGLVDGARMAIRGGSAGGYTTLCALTFRDTFATGASYYGVGDLELLARETHKFESRYLDKLIGPDAGAMHDRSPIHHVDQLKKPVIIFQGLEDQVVPPSQAETMVAALARSGIRHEYHAYPGEQHGFRSAATIASALEAELAFYRSVFEID